MNENDALLKIRIVTPNGEAASASCDSIRLNMADDASGRSGGSVGIRKGHENAVISLAPGVAEGRLNGELVFSAKIKGGFATVKDNLVTVVTDSLEDIELTNNESTAN